MRTNASDARPGPAKRRQSTLVQKMPCRSRGRILGSHTVDQGSTLEGLAPVVNAAKPLESQFDACLCSVAETNTSLVMHGNLALRADHEHESGRERAEHHDQH